MWDMAGVFVMLLLGLSASAQTDSLALHYAGTITAAELREHLEVLASDEYMGRDTGKEGQKMVKQDLILK